jgi:hypothetical protein
MAALKEKKKQVANKCMKRFSTSSAIKEIKIKITTEILSQPIMLRMQKGGEEEPL